MTKIFIDSSILIELYKKNPDAILKFRVVNKSDFLLYINPIVVSGVVFILKKKLKLTVREIQQILKGLIILPIGQEIITITYDYMHKYNMKPNDAIIAATCKYHKIRNLLTIDNDFEQVCSNENIEILS